MSDRRGDWAFGVVASHEELDEADRRYWASLTPSERVRESLILSLTAYRLAAPDGPPHRIDRAAFGVRRRRGSVPAGRGARGGGVEVPVIAREDLIRNKLAAGRAQDEQDARALGGELATTKRKKRTRR